MLTLREVLRTHSQNRWLSALLAIVLVIAMLATGLPPMMRTPVEAVGGIIHAIAAGNSHSLALKSDGTVWAWGYNEFGQLGDGTDNDSSHPIQVLGPGGTGYLTNVVDIAAGGAHSLALKSDGTVWAWGYNEFGQLGDGTGDDSSYPVQVLGPGGTDYLTDVIAIAAGSAHSLALKSDGTVWAWGYSYPGQLGDGTGDDSSYPVQVKASSGTDDYLTGVDTIAAGFGHSLALKSDGTVWAWGYNYAGQLGNGEYGSYNSKSYPVQVKASSGTGDYLTGVNAIAAGYSHSFVLKSDGTVWAWGLNQDGQLGGGSSNVYDLYPIQAKDSTGSPLTGVSTIAAGSSHSLALKSDGTIWSWGWNRDGQLGDGTSGITNKSSHPTQVMVFAGDIGKPMIATGSYHSLALKSDGTVWAWGRNNNGQLGDGTSGNDSNKSYSVQVKGPGGTGNLTDVAAIAAGVMHSLALKSDGTVWAWGYNNYGQLGDGTSGNGSNKSYPVQVKGPGGTGNLTDVVAITTGHYYSLALKSDGTVWTWGWNYGGQLGDGTSGLTANKSSPVQVKGPGGVGNLTDVVAIATDYQHSLALKSDGTVWAWGWNQDGQLGDGTSGITANKSSPVQVKGPGGVGNLTDVAAIAAGGDHSLALKSDGTVWAWGDNNYGQLGDGTSGDTGDKLYPVQVRGPGGAGYLTGVSAITAGVMHSLVLKSDGTVWAWGHNTYGQLGDGTSGFANNKSFPVQVKDSDDATGYLTGIIVIAAGYGHSLVLKSDGTVWTWGSNEFGQLGDGTSGSDSNKISPVQVLLSENSNGLNLKAPPTFTIRITVSSALIVSGDTYTFTSMAGSYAPIAPTVFTIENTGKGRMTNLDVTLSGDDAEDFSLDKSGLDDRLEYGRTTTFALNPITGLNPGVYTAAITVSDNTLAESYTFDISFMVTVPVTYTLSQVGGTADTVDSTGIVIAFDEPVVDLPIDNITINNDSGAVTKGTVLTPSEDYTVWTISLDGVTNQGNVDVIIDSFDTYVISLNTQTATAVYKDTTKPLVSSVSPSGTEVGISGEIVITFSEAIDQTASGTVQLNTLPPWSIADGTWSDNNTVFTISYSGLAYGTPYTVYISGFQDISSAGNVMEDDDSHSFTTKLFTVTYDLNGGSGTVPAESPKAPGATFTAAGTSGITAPADKQFKEWNTSSTGTGSSYEVGASVVMPEQDLTLYAIWVAVPPVTTTAPPPTSSSVPTGGPSIIPTVATTVTATTPTTTVTTGPTTPTATVTGPTTTTTQTTTPPTTVTVPPTSTITTIPPTTLPTTTPTTTATTTNTQTTTTSVTTTTTVPPGGNDSDDDGWSLFSLILCILGGLLAIVALVWAFLLQKTVRPLWIILTVVLGIIGVVVFLVTADFSLPMGFANIWTVVYAAIFLAGLICLVLGLQVKKT